MKPGAKRKIDPWINVILRVNRGKRHGGHTPFIHTNGSGHVVFPA